MACRNCSHKAARHRNKADFFCPYGRNALKANKKDPNKGLSFCGHSKDNEKLRGEKRQKAGTDIAPFRAVQCDNCQSQKRFMKWMPRGRASDIKKSLVGSIIVYNSK